MLALSRNHEGLDFQGRAQGAHVLEPVPFKKQTSKHEIPAMTILKDACSGSIQHQKTINNGLNGPD